MRQTVRTLSLRVSRGVWPNQWDIIAFLILFGLLVLIIRGAHGMHLPAAALQTPITLSPWALPEYALRTVLRMLAAMLISLVFALGFGALAAKSRHAEKILVPMLDILQSVPVLGFISFTVTFFLNLFPRSVFGAECASIFAIFTSQAWNMAFSFYQSLKTLPTDLHEVSRSFRFSGWQRFFQLEAPFAMPSLIWNMMMSMSAGWFFVVASEAITVGNQSIMLPGIGSYVATAINDRNLGAVGYAIGAMALIILAYDQLLFRPLVTWAEKFRFEETSGQYTRSWVLTLLARTRFMHRLSIPFEILMHRLQRTRFSPVKTSAPSLLRLAYGDMVWMMVMAATTVWGVWELSTYLSETLSWSDAGEAFMLGFATLARVAVLIALTSLIWVPVGVWIGLRPRLAQKLQPLAQFLAAFPANLCFPVAVMGIVHFHLNPDIWLSPLIVLGAQWYILFNVIAGASAFPADLREAAANLRIRGRLWWTHVILPGIFPAFVTGALTAAGGAWNASIVAELVSWGDTTVEGQGLGAYMARQAVAADYPRLVLGIAVMCLLVTCLNHFMWQRLYRIAERRLRLY